MSKPKLYLGVDGVLLVHGSEPDPYLGREIVPYAKTFMHWAHEHFALRWLTTHRIGEMTYLADQLGLPRHALVMCGFIDSKIEALNPAENLYWVDAELIPSEISWFAEHGLADRFIQVPSGQGVTEATKTKLENLIRKER